jgi:hypothetical protein
MRHCAAPTTHRIRSSCAFGITLARAKAIDGLIRRCTKGNPYERQFASPGMGNAWLERFKFAIYLLGAFLFAGRRPAALPSLRAISSLRRRCSLTRQPRGGVRGGRRSRRRSSLSAAAVRAAPYSGLGPSGRLRSCRRSVLAVSRCSFTRSALCDVATEARRVPRPAAPHLSMIRPPHRSAHRKRRRVQPPSGARDVHDLGA